MALMDILEQAQGGGFLAAAGQAAGLDAGEAKVVMHALAPAIADALRERAGQDEEAFDRLLDLLEDGGDDVLSVPGALAKADALSDGKAVLKDIYGTEAKALKSGQALVADVPAAKLRKLMPIAAAAVLAALVRGRRNAPMTLAGAQTAVGDSGGGLLGTIVSAVVQGVVEGATRSLKRKTTRRRSTTTTKRRKKTTRRRTTRPSLESIFGELLGLGRR